jgi:hypothetical protein
MDSAVPANIANNREISDARWVNFADAKRLLEHLENQDLLEKCHSALLRKPT